MGNGAVGSVFLSYIYVTNYKYKYQIQEDKKENLGGLKSSVYQVAKIAWLYEDWRSQYIINKL